jgi:poly(hydroxyalkanoate) granule-associated protein
MTRQNRTESSTRGAEQIQAQLGRMAREMGDSAHQVWLAGIGALARAQAEGSRLFEELAEEGRQVGEGENPDSAAARLDGVRRSVDSALGRAQARAGEAWDSLGRSFDSRVQDTLRKFEVASRADVDALGARIDALAHELRKRPQAAPTGPASPDEPL